MKAIFCLPAHPSYFNDEYTQKEIDAAIAEYDRLFGGLISKGRPDAKVKVEFLLLRQPGKTVTVIFDSAGLPAGHEFGIEQYRQTSARELRTHVANLTELMKGKRDGGEFPSEFLRPT